MWPQADLCRGAILGYRGGEGRVWGCTAVLVFGKKHSLCSVSWGDFKEAT